MMYSPGIPIDTYVQYGSFYGFVHALVTALSGCNYMTWKPHGPEIPQAHNLVAQERQLHYSNKNGEKCREKYTKH